MRLHRIAMAIAGAAVASFLVAAPLAIAADSDAGKIPNLLGPWNNTNRFRLKPAPTGPKPIGDLAGYTHVDRGVDAKGQDFSGNFWVGDYNNPNLTAAGAAALKISAENAEKEKDPFWPATFCYPFGPTDVLQPQPLVFLQEPDKVVMIYERDHQIRHVFLNVPHSKNPKPSWYGESVGHYENGDTLVVDTVGFNAKAFLDRYGSPYSDQLHMIERYKVAPDSSGMQVDVTYDDPKMYKEKWHSEIGYRKGRAFPTEEVCAESAEDPVTGKLNAIPVAAKSDF